MEDQSIEAQGLQHTLTYPAFGRTALELLAQPIDLVEAQGPRQTPPQPFRTAPHPTAPDHTGYPDVSPPDQEYLYE